MITRLFSAALLCLACGLTSVAQAGVAGNSYTGLLTLNNDDTGISSATFGTESWIFSRQFLTDPEPILQQGRFSETDLFVVSFWQGTLVTPGSRSVRPVNGISIFGVVTTVNFPGRGDTPLASGIYLLNETQPTQGQLAELGAFAPVEDAPAFSAGCLACPTDAVLRTRRVRVRAH